MGGGRVSVAPVGVERMGQVDSSWLTRDCAQSRAVAARVLFKASEVEVKVDVDVDVDVEVDERNGFVSRRRRLPRSKA